MNKTQERETRRDDETVGVVRKRSELSEAGAVVWIGYNKLEVARRVGMTSVTVWDRLGY